MTKAFTAKQLKALPLLACGTTGAEAACKVGVLPSTISEWLNHNPKFAAEVARLRREATDEAMEEFRATLSLALRTMRKLLTHGKTDSVRYRAAEFIISRAGDFGESEPSSLDLPRGDQPQRMNLQLVLAGLGVRHGHG